MFKTSIAPALKSKYFAPAILATIIAGGLFTATPASAATFSDETVAATVVSVGVAPAVGDALPAASAVSAQAVTVTTSVAAAVTGTADAQVTAKAKALAKKHAAAAKKKAAAAKKKAVHAKKVAKAKADRKRVITVAKKYRGIRYTYGGASPATGFDCSGFTKFTFKKAVDMVLPHSARAQASLGKRVAAKDAKPGDLVVYSYPGNRYFHVAIYLNKTRIIHAKQPGAKTQIGRMFWGGSESRVYVDLIDPKVGL